MITQTGLQLSNLYIAQVKRECGIIERENLHVATRRIDCLHDNSTTAASTEELVPRYKPKSEDARQPQCPEDKKKAIKDALKYYKMI